MNEQFTEIYNWFQEREIPKRVEMQGQTIADTKKYLETQFIRMEHGSAVIQQASYNVLVRLREAVLNKKN